MRTRAGILAGGAVLVAAAGLAGGLLIGHAHKAAGTSSLVAAQHVANGTVVPGLTPSSACVSGPGRCFADPQSVIATSNAVFEAMRTESHLGAQLRCFPHYIGGLSRTVRPGGTLVDSCVVDVPVDGHTAYAFVDPVTTGPMAHPIVHGSTVHFAAN
jgi:hypothetical protein